MRYKTLVLFILVVSCENEASIYNGEIQRTGNTEFSLKKISSIGEEILPESGEAYHQVGGAAFSKITALAVSNGRLFVLDSRFKKIVIFNDDGNLEDIVLGGDGRGPGEFQLPAGLFVENETIWVYDYTLQRITELPHSGDVTTFQIPSSSRSLVVKEDMFWVSRMGNTSYHGAVYDGESNEMTEILPTEEKDIEHFPTGGVSWVGLSPSNKILYALGRSGLWFTVEEDGAYEMFGTELMPNANAVEIQGIWAEQKQTIGVSSFNDFVVIGWMEKDLQSTPPGVKNVWLDFFLEDGTHIGASHVPHSWVDAFTIHDQYLYLAVNEPYPRVIKYEIKIDE